MIRSMMPQNISVEKRRMGRGAQLTSSHDNIYHNINGCRNEAGEVDISIQVTGVERETIEHQGSGHPAELQS